MKNKNLALLFLLVFAACKKPELADPVAPKIVQVDPSNANSQPIGSASPTAVPVISPSPDTSVNTTTTPTSSPTPAVRVTLDATPNSCMIWILGPSCVINGKTYQVNKEFHDDREAESTGLNQLVCNYRAIDYFQGCGGANAGIKGVMARFTNSNIAGISPSTCSQESFK